MSALGRFLRKVEGGKIAFFCPGCRYAHVVRVEPGNRPCWEWNDNLEHPTLSPSVLNRTGRAVDPSHVPEPGDPPEVCHLYLTLGDLHFLSDCTHHLAGQTVPLPPFRWGD